jgi:hypothetical protein
LLDSGKITKEEAEQVAASVKQQHPVFTSFVVVDGVNSWDYEYTASARTKVKGKQKDPGAVPAMVVNPDFSNNRLNGNMTVKYLYNEQRNHAPGSGTTGKESLDGAFETIQEAGLSYYWSRGHILNSGFGGKAVTSNLIPIDQSTNLKQIAFDNKIRTVYSSKEAPVFIVFNVSRHDDDRFVSSYTGNASKMKQSGKNWTETGGESIGQFNSGTINKPAPGSKKSIKLLSSKSTEALYREVGKANNLSVGLLKDIVASGKSMNTVDDLKAFINGNKDYSDVKKVRYLNRIEAAAGRIDFS